jgi:thioredoxin-related protein
MRRIFLFSFVSLAVVFTIASFTARRPRAPKEQYVLLYYGATDCYYCNLPENIHNINTLTETIGNKYAGVKKVLVCMDKDLKEGLTFINKYDSSWNEITIGSFYQNELAFQYLNNTKIPGVPHIIFLKRNYVDENQYHVPVASKTDILVDLVGGTAINQWIKDGFPLAK